MKRTVTSLLAILLLGSTVIAAPFVNLDFEQATMATPSPPSTDNFFGPISAADAIPGWTAEFGSASVTTISSIEQIDETQVVLDFLGVNPVYPTISPFPPPFDFPNYASRQPLDGNYSLELYATSVNPWYQIPSISQTGDIPSSAHSIELLIRDSGQLNGPQANPSVTLNGNQISLFPISTTSDITTLVGDISAFAGTTSQLTIADAVNPTDSFYLLPNTENLFELDDISFSPNVVPEPSTLTLLALGVVGLVVSAGGGDRQNGRLQ